MLKRDSQRTSRGQVNGTRPTVVHKLHRSYSLWCEWPSVTTDGRSPHRPTKEVAYGGHDEQHLRKKKEGWSGVVIARPSEHSGCAPRLEACRTARTRRARPEPAAPLTPSCPLSQSAGKKRRLTARSRRFLVRKQASPPENRRHPSCTLHGRAQQLRPRERRG